MWIPGNGFGTILFFFSPFIFYYLEANYFTVL